MKTDELLIQTIEKIDGLKDDFYDYKALVVKQHAEMNDNLKEHMRRSENTEVQLDILKTEVKPVLEEIKGLKTAFNILSFAVGIAGGITALYFKFKS